MRRALAAAALLAIMPTAHAQDKGKSDFTHSAEFRVRDTFEQNESGNKNSQPSHHNGILQRFKLGLGFKANEKFSVNATLLQAATWGQTSGEALGDRGHVTGTEPPNGDESNFMAVNEAYGTWMMSEDFSAKFGRQNFTFGDGSVMSANDWQQQPYAFDGAVLKYEAEFGRFAGFAFKYRDLTGNTTATSDPQHDAYGVVFDLKTMPEVIKMVNAYVIQDVADGAYGSSGHTVTGMQNQNALRWGLLGGFSFGPVDLKAAYNSVGGKNTDVSAGGTTTERTIAENMIAAEAAFNLPNIMGMKIWLGYHQDSGTSAGDRTTKDNTYDPYFYDQHNGTGPMEIIAWGNLTDISAGLNLKPTDNTDVGVAYYMFSRTNTDDTVNFGMFGQNLAAPGTNKDKATGSEIDVWGEHKYDGGLSTLARVGYFMPDSGLKNSSVRKMSDSIMQVQIQGKLTF